MSRSIAHFLLIFVVLACPVQCVIGGDSCCVSKADESEVASEQTCQASDHCCHGVADGSFESKSGSDEPLHAPPSDDDCNCDCLCKGAISSASLIAQNCDATQSETAAVCRTASTDVSRHSEMSHAHSPDALSGREIRTLRMSFQV
jgi:hypothetical protein